MGEAAGAPPLDVGSALLLLGAALLVGALNALAGGGAFVSFPTLVFVGVPPIAANASATVASWLGLLASVWAYRKELGAAPHRALLALVSIVGGAVGALLLLLTPSA